MIQINDCRLETVSAHQVGNIHHGEPLLLSETPLDQADPELQDILIRYFLGPFEIPEFFHFDLNGEVEKEHPVYSCAQTIFRDGATALHEQSRKIASHLYESSDHPNIKPGELFVALLRDVVVEDELTDAIAIFKSETKQSFLKTLTEDNDLSVTHDRGISIEKPDKACLVFRLAEPDGYKVCVIDKTNRREEALFWKQHFLQVKPCADNYHYTESFMKATKKFVSSPELEESFQLEKADKLDYLNASVQYFRDNDTFDETEYANEVFKDEAVAGAFQDFRKTFQESNGLPATETFDISEQAVKKQARSMRSVLKLDKNFHVYIHGDKKLIEKGYDETVGKYFYKIYFDEES